MKIRPVGTELFYAQRQADRRTDKQTDRHSEASSRFSQFWKRAYIVFKED